MIQKCFLSGVTSDMALIHHIVVVDPLANSTDDVYISDSCYKSMCASDDDEVAKCWSMVKASESAGYSDMSKVHVLIETLRKEGFELAFAEDLESKKLYFVATRSPELKQFNVGVTIRSMYPIHESLLNRVRSVPYAQGIQFSQWVGGRWMVFDSTTHLARPMPVQASMLRAMTLKPYWIEVGSVDPFLKLLNLQTAIGVQLLVDGDI